MKFTWDETEQKCVDLHNFTLYPRKMSPRYDKPYSQSGRGGREKNPCREEKPVVHLVVGLLQNKLSACMEQEST